MRPNEGFSRRGHARHLCRDCTRLPPEELVFRQGVRDIDRLIGGSMRGMIKRRRRELIEAYLRHANLRLRLYAGSLLATRERPMVRPNHTLGCGDDLPLGPDNPEQCPF